MLVCDFDLSKKCKVGGVSRESLCLTRRARRTRSWHRLRCAWGLTRIYGIFGKSHAESAENTELAQASLCLGSHANLGDLLKVSRRGLAPRITGISRNVYIRLTRTFYFLNTNFSNCTNAFPKKILRDPCDTWRLVSGVSRVSHGMFILGSCES